MKLTVAFLAVAFSAANASTLRGKDKGFAHHLNTFVALKGVKGEPSADDMDIVGQALIASYNDVYWQAGHYLTGSHETESLGVNPLGPPCRLCPRRDDDSVEGTEKQAFVFAIKAPVSRNDANSLLGAALTEECAGMCNKDASAELEVAFCNKIRSSGSEFLMSTKDCSVQFEPKAVKGSKHLAPAVTHSADTIATTLSLEGVEGDVESKEDLALIAKAYVSAYNDVHWNADHYMADAEIPVSDSTPLGPPCRLCPRRDDDSVEGLVFDIITPVVQRDGATPNPLGPPCRLCPRRDDDSVEVASPFGMDDEMTRKAVQVAFCKKLQASFSDKFSAALNCAIVKEIVMVADIGGTSA